MFNGGKGMLAGPGLREGKGERSSHRTRKWRRICGGGARPLLQGVELTRRL